MKNLIIAAVSVAAAAFLWYIARSRLRSRAAGREDSPYHLGLDALIASDSDTALRYLTRAVRDDPRNVDAYVKLGNLLRERGQLKQAIQVHRELLVKRRLPPNVRSDTVKSLALDLAAAGRWREVLDQLGTLPRQDRSDAVVLRLSRDAYESSGELDKAAQAHRELLKVAAPGAEPAPGIYRAHLALGAMKRGDLRRAKAEFQAALKEDPETYLAYLHLGDIAVREEDTERAVAYWMKLVTDRPTCAHLVFDRLERAYFDMGDFGRMMGIYEDLVAASPSNFRALTGLSKMLERKGDVEEALRVAREAVKHEGDSFDGHRQLIEILLRNNRYEEAAEAARSLLSELEKRGSGDVCPSCGAELAEHGWRCGSCRTWIHEC